MTDVVDLDLPQSVAGGCPRPGDSHGPNGWPGPNRRPGPNRWPGPNRRPGRRVISLAIIGVIVIALLLVSRARQQQAQAKTSEDELKVTILSAVPIEGRAAAISGEQDARVRLRLSSNVPVSVLDGELDNAPPISAGSTGRPLRTAELTVSWQISCADVDSSGPRLLELDLRGHYSVHRVELVLSAPDADLANKAFRLAAVNACRTAAIAPSPHNVFKRLLGTMY